ncbi:unnamed protein product [Leuciscus chuanchicus]
MLNVYNSHAPPHYQRAPSHRGRARQCVTVRVYLIFCERVRLFSIYQHHGLGEHILLALEQVAHPHTAQSIKACVDKCMQEWGISNDKIVTVITDNGSNMVAAFKHSTQVEELASSDDQEEFPRGESDSEEEIEDHRYQNMEMDMERMPCVVHTLQLVVHMLNKEASVKRILDKAGSIVKLFRKSSVATQKILDKCGLIVVNDCPTRWSSTYYMIARLLKVKDPLSEIANEMGWDNLLSSEWQKLSSLHELMLPFAEHTQTLQSDTMSMSLIVPALLDLHSHLTDFEENTNHQDFATLARKMKVNLNQRFAWVLDPSDEKFSPLVAAAFFLNPTVCDTLLDVADDSVQELFKQAEGYVVRCTQSQETHPDDDVEELNGPEPDPGPPSSSSRQPVFRFLSKCRAKPKPKSSTCSIRQQLSKYKELSQPIPCDSGIQFWLGKCDTFYHSLKPLALDLLAMPASQAFAERVFSVTAILAEFTGVQGHEEVDRLHLTGEGSGKLWRSVNQMPVVNKEYKRLMNGLPLGILIRQCPRRLEAQS